MSDTQITPGASKVPSGDFVCQPERTLASVASTLGLVALLSLGWAVQYSLVAPTVWLWHLTVAVVAFASRSAGHIILLFIPVVGWIWLAYLLLREHPERAPKDRGYLRPWGMGLLSR